MQIEKKFKMTVVSLFQNYRIRKKIQNCCDILIQTNRIRGKLKMTMVSLILPRDLIDFFWNYLRVEDTYLTRKRRLVKNGLDQSDHRAHFWSEGI